MNDASAVILSILQRICLLVQQSIMRRLYFMSQIPLHNASQEPCQHAFTSPLDETVIGKPYQKHCTNNIFDEFCFWAWTPEALFALVKSIIVSL